MRAWPIATTLLTAACGFTPAGDVNGGDGIDAAADDGAVADGGPDGGAVDARLVDAAPIDAPGCPAAYTVSSGGSRYAFHATLVAISTAAADCDDDLPGRTHLATFENGDADAVLTAVAASSAATVYVGGRCDGALDCDVKSNWFWQGSNVPIPSNAWNGGEPAGDLEFAYVEDNNGWKLVSSAGLIVRSYLCECEP